MRIETFTAAVAASALLAASPAHAQLRANAGVVAGNARIGSQFQCATSGPTIGAPWYAGLSLPTEGIAACGLSGLVDDRTGIAGPLAAAAAASGPMASTGAFTGTAKARANYWNLGVSASGTATGDVAPGTYHQAAAYASFAEDLTYTSASVANGTAGYTNFSFLVDGMMQNLSVAPYTQQGSIALSFLVNNLLWTAFLASSTNNEIPFVAAGGSTGLPGNFVLLPGSLDGSANITTTGNFGFTWGTPLHVEVAMYTSVGPCCYGASLTSDFYNSALLTGVDAYASGGLVRDFVVNTSSGRRLGAGGIVSEPPTTVPEPGPFGLVLLGLAAAGWSVRRRAARRPGTPT